MGGTKKDRTIAARYPGISIYIIGIPATILNIESPTESETLTERLIDRALLGIVPEVIS